MSQRECHAVYPVVFFDALRVKIRDDSWGGTGRVERRPLVCLAQFAGLKRLEVFEQCFFLVRTQLRSEFVAASAVARI